MAFKFLPLTPVPLPRLDALDLKFAKGRWIYELQQVAQQLENYLIQTSPFIDAPSDGQTYGRKNAAWAVVSGTVTTGNLTETISNILAIVGGTGAVVGAGTTIQVKQAGIAQSGFLTSVDWNIFNGKQNALSLGNLTESTSAVLTIAGGTGAVVGAGTSIRVTLADATHDGYLSSFDWNRFNSGSGGITTGNLTEATSAVLTIVGGTAAVVGTGTSIQVKQSSAIQAGYLSSADWSTFNGKANAFTTGALSESTSAVLTITGGTGAVIGSGTSIQVKQSSAGQSGYLSSTDWSTFNGKQSALTFGNLTEATSAVLTITGGTGAVIGSGASIQVKQAGAAQSGYLSSVDWNTFNNKGGPVTTGNLTETVSGVLTITGGTGAVVGTGTTIKVTLADATHDGYLSSADWNLFHAGGGGGTVGKGLMIATAAGYLQP